MHGVRRRIILRLIEEIPAGHCNDQATCDLHHEKRNTEEGQNFAAEECGIRRSAKP